MDEQFTLQKALFTIKKLKHLLQGQAINMYKPVAIVGLSCRYPQAHGKQAYWELLSKGKNIISRLPDKRWDLLRGSKEEKLRDKTHPYWGGYLEDAGAFDPYFFGISPREAIRMDPQHRLLLEVTYEAFEDAGLTIEALAGSNTGVFASLNISELSHLQKMESELDALYLPTGNAISIAANRISYFFDLKGPSVILDSACSSSMVSLHLACLNLQNHLCDLALACSARLNLLPYVNFVLSKAKMLSPDGQCKTFDAEANGYVQGEGVGVLVLKRLDQALQDRDRIYAVICGSAVNQDGKTNGLTAPNGLQQEKLLKAAYSQANINPQHVSYVECHGTGTFLGDPIEVQALAEVLGKHRDDATPCWIGSVKTNIGHLEPAAGIASVIKVALALQHAQIPPHLNVVTPNPHIAFDQYHLRIPQQLEHWPQYGPYRIAGVSGFGFGGTNAHVVLRELSVEEKAINLQSQVKQTEIFILSAKDSIALKMLIERWCDYLASNLSIDLGQICYHLHLHRSIYAYRLAILADTTNSLLEKLQLLKPMNLEHFANTHDILLNLKKNSAKKSSVLDIESLKNEPAQLALLYVNGANINWRQYEEIRWYPMLDMPLYPWQHKEYWPNVADQPTAVTASSVVTYPLQGKKVDSPLAVNQFEFSLTTRNLPDLEDTYQVMHVGYYLEIVAYAVKELFQETQFTITNFSFLSPLIIPNDLTVSVQLILEPMAGKASSFRFYSHTQGQQNWVQHAHGQLTLGVSFNDQLDSIALVKNRMRVNEPAEQLYRKVQSLGMSSGASIRWTHQYWLGAKEILCEFAPPVTQRKNAEFIIAIHPGVIDGSIQPLFMLLPEGIAKPFIASTVGKFQYGGMKQGQLYLYGVLKEIKTDCKEMICDSYLLNAQGDIIVAIEDLCLTQLDNKFAIKEFMQADIEKCVDLSSVSIDERRTTITDFLLAQVAVLFSMPKEDIQLDSPLSEMGIDSLMAIVLMRAIERGLGFNCSMQDILQGPTLAELTEIILNNTKHHAVLNTIKNDQSHHWVAYRTPQPHAKIRLFCFPYGGGGASIYRDWQKTLPDSIEVCPIQLPGRENRMNEKPINNLEQLINALINDIQPELDLPFAFFGHSFGSLMAFELTRQLRKRNLPLPVHLFASAFPDPRLPTKNLDDILSQLMNMDLNLFALDQHSLAALSDEKINHIFEIFSQHGMVGYDNVIADKEVVKILLPIFIGDMYLVKSYQYTEDSLLSLPITVLIGKKDTWVSAKDQSGWKDFTNMSCVFHEFDGGHLFIKENQVKEDVLQLVAQTLS